MPSWSPGLFKNALSIKILLTSSSPENNAFFGKFDSVPNRRRSARVNLKEGHRGSRGKGNGKAVQRNGKPLTERLDVNFLPFPAGKKVFCSLTRWQRAQGLHFNCGVPNTPRTVPDSQAGAPPEEGFTTAIVRAQAHIEEEGDVVHANLTKVYALQGIDFFTAVDSAGLPRCR